MPNFTFSFAAALFALPLAGVPILLHLLFKQKSPVVQFSTLRFIKLSVQRTAARRRVQKWLLLACRALLAALLIWAIAGPSTRAISSFGGGGIGGGSGGGSGGVGSSGGRPVAAIVVDTSFSMKLQDGQIELLSKAETMVHDLLRDQLAGAQVALFTSKPSADGKAEMGRDASAMETGWVPLRAQASEKPLEDRIKSAVHFLDQQNNEQKWLIVISDFQAREFPESIPELKDGRTVLLDLHPTEPRSLGITKVSIDPAQPIPGIPAAVNVEVTGQPNGSVPVVLRVGQVDGPPPPDSAPEEAVADSSGIAHVQFPSVTLAAQRWQLLTAAFTKPDSMSWDNTRSLLVEVPPKREVAVIPQAVPSPHSDYFLSLALDPAQGRSAEWPIAVTRSVTPKTQAIVVAWKQWPGATYAKSLLKFAASGHTVVLFLSPGMERTWGSIPQDERDALTQLLPSPPIQRPGNSLCRAGVADEQDRLLHGLLDQKLQVNAIVVRQLVPLAASGNSSTILNAIPADPTPGSRTQGLLYRKPVGRGMCFTCATLPESEYTNLAAHPMFLPLMVKMAIEDAGNQGTGQNVELGQPLVLDGSQLPGTVNELYIQDPQGGLHDVPAQAFTDGSRQFRFTEADDPGLYHWQKKLGNDRYETVGIANVRLPAAESDLKYQPAEKVAAPGPNTVIATSIEQLKTKVASLTAPQPQWSLPLAIVMFLLCLEALMGSWSKLWQPATFRGFFPGIKAPAPAAGLPS
jgi:hypothetical protein